LEENPERNAVLTNRTHNVLFQLALTFRRFNTTILELTFSGKMPTESLDFVLSSETRLRIMSFLSKDAGTPTQLAREVQKHLSHISRALRELESKDLVTCSNPQNSKPRVYQLTLEGDRLLKEIYRSKLSNL
jgi:DNA-binding MarR family transcriptional regulator